MDKDLGVVTSTLEGIPPWVKNQFLEDEENDALDELTFFYHPGADVVVLNVSHIAADVYELLVISYLGMDEKDRIMFKEITSTERIGNALAVLDQIIVKRGNNGRS